MTTSMRDIGVTALAMVLYGATSAAQIDTGRITLVKDKHPSWSPDGRAITFYSNRDGDNEIYTINADGSGLRQLTFNEFEDRTPVWSPDGAHIVFQSERDGNNEIYRIAVKGGHEQRLTNHPGSDEHPKFSSTGETLVFNSDRDDGAAELYRKHLQTQNIVRLTHWPLMDTYGEESPDGSQIVWRRVLHGNESDPNDRNSEIFVADANGSNALNLTNHLAFDGWPAWSTDSAWILFSSNRKKSDPSDFDIWAMRRDGTALQAITHSPGYEDARADISVNNTLTFNRQIRGSGAMEIFVTPWVVADEPVTTESSDGITVHGYKYFGTLGDSTPLVLLFHQGLSNARGEYPALTEWLNSEGYRALAWDLRSGGELYGSVNQTARDLPEGITRNYCSAYADMDAAVRYSRQNVRAEKVVVWGSSYSGALAFQLAAKHPDIVAGLIAFSPSTGNSVAGCRARKWTDTLSAPAIVFRAESEMNRETSIEQQKLLTAARVKYVSVPGGVHGSSTLLDSRTGNDMTTTRSQVIHWLRTITR